MSGNRVISGVSFGRKLMRFGFFINETLPIYGHKNWSLCYEYLLDLCFIIIHRFDVKSNGLISSMPFIAQAVICVFGGWITDLLIKRGHLRTITARKVDTGLGLLVPALTVVLAGYMGCRAWLAVMFFIISVGFNSFTVPGCKTG